MRAIHQPCPDCGSTDALQCNDDGTTFCHSCKHFTPSEGSKDTPTVPKNYITGKFRDISDRKLTKETCHKYGYTVSNVNGKLANIATYKDLKGTVKWQKIRYVDEKKFVVNKLSGNNTEPILWGMHLFAGHKKKLTITEGEIDCLTVSQLFQNKYAVVSLPLGANSAEKAIRHNIEWINQFEEIYLVFDNDKAGHDALNRAVQILPFGKTKIVSMSMKDPNEMLQAGKIRDFEDDFYRAKEYRPDGIVYGEELWEEIKKPIEWGYPYPFQSLTEATYGVRIPEFILVGAGTGIGKTTFITQLESHFAHRCKLKVGVIHLEQQVKETCLYLMSHYAQKPLFRPDIIIAEDEKKEIFESAINNGNLFFYDAFGCKDFEIIKNIIRYLVTGQGCQIVFLDHISALGSGIRAGTDVNQVMKNISSDLASLTRELNFTLVAVSHLRKSNSKKSWEDGERPTLDDFEGSSDIVKWTNFVYTLSRNKNAKGDAKHTSHLQCLKDRYTGRADGLIIPIKYMENTCQMVETTQIEEFINDTNKDEGRGSNRNTEEQEEF